MNPLRPEWLCASTKDERRWQVSGQPAFKNEVLKDTFKTCFCQWASGAPRFWLVGKFDCPDDPSWSSFGDWLRRLPSSSGVTSPRSQTLLTSGVSFVSHGFVHGRLGQCWIQNDQSGLSCQALSCFTARAARCQSGS